MTSTQTRILRVAKRRSRDSQKIRLPTGAQERDRHWCELFVDIFQIFNYFSLLQGRSQGQNVEKHPKSEQEQVETREKEAFVVIDGRRVERIETN